MIVGRSDAVEHSGHPAAAAVMLVTGFAMMLDRRPSVMRDRRPSFMLGPGPSINRNSMDPLREILGSSPRMTNEREFLGRRHGLNMRHCNESVTPRWLLN